MMVVRGMRRHSLSRIHRRNMDKVLRWPAEGAHCYGGARLRGFDSNAWRSRSVLPGLSPGACALWTFASIALLAVGTPLLGTTYYVDKTGGSDGNDGTTPATAWQAVSRVNRSAFAPGDQVLFKRGEVWLETL